jgi:PHD/YefM family antitoxin component YafN of YafNO toxin-antitoxin module
MSLAINLLRAEPIGVRELKNHLSAVLKRHEPRVVTDHNQPRYILVPYDDMIELAEILDELSDPKLLKQVAEGREGYEERRSVPLESLAKSLKLKYC